MLVNRLAYIRFLCIRVANKVCSIFNKTVYYETHFGVKVLNRKVKRTSSSTILTNVYDCDPNELYLGVDGLCDEYSSVDILCKQSPHYGLMKACESGLLSDCIYIDKERKGSLDGRDVVAYDDTYHIKAYERMVKNEDTYLPVSYYVINGRKYISDGKHRAAYIAFKNRLVKCKEVKLCCESLDYMMNLYRIMEKTPEKYKKNIALIEKIFVEYGVNYSDRFQHMIV